MTHRPQQNPSWLHSRHAAVTYVSQTEHHVRTAAWINAALGRGEKVYYHQGSQSLPRRVQLVTAAHASHRRRDRSQFEVIDAGLCWMMTEGHPERLLLVYLDLIGRARRQGYQTVSFTVDDAALRDMTGDQAGTRTARLERELHRLTGEPGVRALCRYDVWGPDRRLLDEMLSLHHEHIADELWSCDLVEDLLVIRGELDMWNADRFATVLIAAAACGVTRLDLRGVRLLSAAAMSALAGAANLLGTRGAELVLCDVTPWTLRVLRLGGLLDHAHLRVETNHDEDEPDRAG